MAQPSLKAEFFVDRAGVVTSKAPPLTSVQRRTIFERDGAACKKCSSPVRRFGNTVSPFRAPPAAVDHILARARGGQNDPSNLRLLCFSCNAAKGAK